ncbi:hypothetical protein AVEN_236981-1 [Araneus ventricosus]|uniref:Uncharacterized protein n=1 Tax=Araneus ventricosus TaxID=182803 RepID=A0A4Y2RHD7_ARAVE|nr:hypothetical protein AVEN_77263-1 [Araneus ventricosus]GBN75067.1 hypothetical protein AVEN_236981-1 [Araneus ventricosus]
MWSENGSVKRWSQRKCKRGKKDQWKFNDKLFNEHCFTADAHTSDHQHEHTRHTDGAQMTVHFNDVRHISNISSSNGQSGDEILLGVNGGIVNSSF